MIELDRIADDYIAAHGGVPTSKGYKGFPAATCISPNDMIVHGIPGDYRAREGDLVSCDIGVTKNGLIADSAATFAVGEISAESQRLLDVCRAALDAGIEAAQVGAMVGDISARRPGRRRGRGLLGRAQPRRPRGRQVLPRGPAGAELRHLLPGPQLVEGMTLAIEPMITAGGPDVHLHDDGWSISTDDGSLTAHFEHTVAITADGPRVLTRAASVLVP